MAGITAFFDLRPYSVNISVRVSKAIAIAFFAVPAAVAGQAIQNAPVPVRIAGCNSGRAGRRGSRIISVMRRELAGRAVAGVRISHAIGK